MIRTEKKYKEAVGIVEACIGPKGMWASPTRYKNQLWTRDFVIAHEETLIELSRSDVARSHLVELSKRQCEDGSIPILFLDDHLSFLSTKIWNSIKNFKISFMLKRYFSRDGVGQLSPETKDSELLYILGVARFARKMTDISFYFDHLDEISKALSYVELKLKKDGLIFGGDWRDTCPDLGDKFLLTNNCLLCHAYELMFPLNGWSLIMSFNLREEISDLKKKINEKFWTGTHYRNYIGVNDLDLLGNAFAILYDIAPEDRWGSIFREIERHETPYGYRFVGVPLPPKNQKEVEIMARIDDIGIIFPFIHGFMILAALKAGKVDLAKRQFEKWTELDGFYEFYDPTTGKGHGSVDQTWSAALYIRVYKALQRV